MGLYDHLITTETSHTKLEIALAREIDKLTEQVKELQQAVKENHKGE